MKKKRYLRKSYNKPKLAYYGKLVELTKGGTQTSAEQGAPSARNRP